MQGCLRALARRLHGRGHRLRLRGIGRLCRITTASDDIHSVYDGSGRLASEAHQVDGFTWSIAYRYDSADRLIAMTYPSGRVVTCERNALGEITAVSSDDGEQSQTLVSAAVYQPFGPLAALTYGNGLEETLAYDLDEPA